MWCDTIFSSLNNTLNSIDRNIEGNMKAETCNKVVRCLEKLENANTELSPFLCLPGYLNLEKEISIFIERINKKLSALFDDFEVALANHNYEDMGIKKHFIEIFVSPNTSIKKYVNKSGLDRIEKMKQSYDMAVKLEYSYMAMV